MERAIQWGARLAFGFGVVVVGLLSVTPAAVLSAPDIWDKAQHFLAYGALGLCGVIGFPTRTTAMRLVAGLVLYGIGLECAQLFVAGRHATFGDAVANGLGAFAGLGIAQLLLLSYRSFATARAGGPASH